MLEQFASSFSRVHFLKVFLCVPYKHPDGLPGPRLVLCHFRAHGAAFGGGDGTVGGGRGGRFVADGRNLGACDYYPNKKGKR